MVGLGAQVFAVDAIALLNRQRRGVAFLRLHAPLFILTFKAAQRLAFEGVVQFAHIHVAEGHKDGVGWVIMGFIEADQLLIGQVGDFRRLTTTVVVVGCGRKQITADALPQLADGGRHRAFHFVEHHAFVFQWRIGIALFAEFNAMAFLGKIQLMQTREKHRIQIYVEQVFEVFIVLGRKGVCGPVAAGHGIHKGIQRAARHHKKRIAYRVLLAAAQCGMFQNVRHPGGIVGHGTQGDHKGFFIVVGSQMIMHRTGGDVLIVKNIDIQRFNARAAEVTKSV